MTQHSALVSPEVAAFVAAVRARLGDLDADVLDDLVGGLEADLADQVADGVQLGDPVAYAGELRTAAGLPEARRPRLGGATRGSARRAAAALRHPDALLDRSRDAFLERAQAPRVRPAWELLATLRPVWWVLRAWVAVTFLDQSTGPWEQVSILPSLGTPALGPALLVVAIVVSTLIGRGLAWPGGRRGTAARLVLLALNTFALVLVVAGLNDIQRQQVVDRNEGGYLNTYSAGYDDAVRSAELRNADRPVTNIFAYDAAGRPIPQVQLVDQDGRPLDLRLQGYRDTGTTTDANGYEVSKGEYFCRTVNGSVVLRNVFPRRVLASDDPALGGEDPQGCRRSLLPLSTPATFPLPGLAALVADPAQPTTPSTAPAETAPGAPADQGGTTTPSGAATP